MTDAVFRHGKENKKTKKEESIKYHGQYYDVLFYSFSLHKRTRTIENPDISKFDL